MEFKAKSVEEAIDLGLKELNLKREKAEIKVIKEPVKGLFGRIKEEAVVDVSKKAEGLSLAVDFVNGILDILDITAKAEENQTEKNTIDIIAEKSQQVIGYRGEVLDAIQTLAGAIANIGEKDYKKIVVNCENYREKRQETIEKLAHKLEEKATTLRREVIIEPMPPFERRIIHTALSNSETVTTRSEGKEPNRYVVIVPNDKDEYSRPYNAGRNHENNGRNSAKGRKFNGNRRDKKDFKSNRPKANGGAKKKTVTDFSSFTFLGNSRDINK